MNMKKAISSIAAVAMAVSALSVSAFAADWSKTGYADNDPNTVNIISTDENGVTFTQTSAGAQSKARITLSDVLADPADITKVKSGSWDVTYTGLSSLTGTEIGWLGGGTYCAINNSTGYGLSPKETKEDGTTVWDDTQTVHDDFKWLIEGPTDASAAEFVFIDWSGQDFVSNNITITISNFKLFDADGNEIAQTAYGAAADATADTTADTTTTTPADTGNASAAAVAAVMAVAGVAAVAAKKRK